MRCLGLVLLLLPMSLWAQGPVEIDKVYETFSEAYTLLDHQMVQGLYEEDAYYFYPQIPIQRGHNKFMKGFKDMFNRARESNTTLKIEFKIVERQLMGDHAYDVGYYRLSKSDGNVSVGKFVTILRRQEDKSWKFVLDTYSSAPLEAFDL